MWLVFKMALLGKFSGEVFLCLLQQSYTFFHVNSLHEVRDLPEFLFLAFAGFRGYLPKARSISLMPVRFNYSKLFS